MIGIKFSSSEASIFALVCNFLSQTTSLKYSHIFRRAIEVFIKEKTSKLRVEQERGEACLIDER